MSTRSRRRTTVRRPDRRPDRACACTGIAHQSTHARTISAVRMTATPAVAADDGPRGWSGRRPTDAARCNDRRPRRSPTPSSLAEAHPGPSMTACRPDSSNGWPAPFSASVTPSLYITITSPTFESCRPELVGGEFEHAQCDAAGLQPFVGAVRAAHQRRVLPGVDVAELARRRVRGRRRTA